MGEKSYCHGDEHSIRYHFGMWTWQFQHYGPKDGLRRDTLGKRNWMPHEQPKVCPKCGFIFSFIGCDRLHLSKCTGKRFIDIQDGIAHDVITVEPQLEASSDEK